MLDKVNCLSHRLISKITAYIIVYVKPDKRCLLASPGWILVWQPMLRIKYRTSKQYDILWEYVIPEILESNIHYVILARKNKYKYSQRPAMPGLEFQYKEPSPDKILGAVNEVYLEMLEEPQKISRSDVFGLVLMKTSSPSKLYKEREERVAKTSNVVHLITISVLCRNQYDNNARTVDHHLII